jgi:serine protease Do
MNRIISNIIAGAAGGLLTFGGVFLAQNQNQPTEVAPVSKARTINFGENAVVAPFDFTKAADKSMPAVVHIKASESKKAAQQRNLKEQQTNPFSFFFGNDMGSFDGGGQRAGTGSGVIFSSDGYIITNNHVVEFADEFSVTLFDNREYKARLVGRDEQTDLAVIKIDAQNLTAIEVSNSDEVRVGEWALAVGNPFDLTSTVTAGIISAKGRDIDIIKGRGAIESFIQTDAAVNPGNSGGALVDLDGKLIGINSAIATQTGSFAGYAFAIPSNFAVKVASDLIQYGEYRRAYLGVDIYDLDGTSAKELNANISQGVVIERLYDKGSAQLAGLQPNDIIVSVDNHAIKNVPELREVIGRAKNGDVLNVIIVRNGDKQEVPVKLRSKTNG